MGRAIVTGTKLPFTAVWQRSARGAVVVGLLMSGMVAQVAAQVRFPWAEEMPGYLEAKYQMPGMCVAAMKRIGRNMDDGSGDTLIFSLPRPPVKAVVDTGARCMRGPRVAALTNRRDYSAMQELLEVAADDSAYFRFLDHRLSVLAGKDSEWEPMHRYPESYGNTNVPPLQIELPDAYPPADSVIAIMRDYGPRRLVNAAFTNLNLESAAKVITRYRTIIGEQRVPGYQLALKVRMINRFRNAGDTAGWRRELDRAVALADSMDKEKLPYTGMPSAESFQLVKAMGALILDSLPHTNPDKWPRQVAAVLKKLSLQQPDPMRGFRDIGMTLPPLQATFWLTSEGNASAAPGPLVRPRPGVWSLIVRVPRDCDIRLCDAEFVRVRLLQRRYGQKLETTLVAGTQGWFLRDDPPSPAQEAEALRRLYFDFYKLTGTLAVTEIKSTRNPPPDLRWRRNSRLESDSTGYTQLGGLREKNGGGPKAYATLVDPQGRVMYRFALADGDLVSIVMLLDGFLR